MMAGPRLRRPIEALLQHRKAAGHVLWMCSLAAIMYATLLPSEQIPTAPRWCIVCGSFGGVDVVLNVFLFMPMGCGLALVGLRPLRAIPLLVLLTVTIETLQFALISGRDASIGDLLMNAAGGAIGFGIGASIDVWLTPTSRGAMRLTLLWLCVWVAVQSVTAYSLVPATNSVQYYGQIKRSLGRLPPYEGDVLLATIDGQPVPNTSYDRAGLAPPALSRPGGALVRVDVVPRERTRRLVSIVRIVDASLDEVLIVGQHGTSLVFGVRTGAAALYLRPIYVGIRDAFPRSQAGDLRDTIRIEAQYAAREVRLKADAGEAHYEANIPLSPAIGWRLFLPLRAYAHREVRDRMFDMLWFVMLLAPIAYWVACSRRDPADPSRRRLTALVIPLGVLIGLVGVPLAFGVAFPGAVEWAGVALATLVGVATARLVFRE